MGKDESKRKIEIKIKFEGRQKAKDKDLMAETQRTQREREHGGKQEYPGLATMFFRCLSQWFSVKKKIDIEVRRKGRRAVYRIQ